MFDNYKEASLYCISHCGESTPMTQQMLLAELKYFSKRSDDVKEDKLFDCAPKSEKFWMVVANAVNSSCSAKHFTYNSAVDEAIRLAKLHPGTKFYITESKGFFVADGISYTQL
jgi:hypothetical protein